MPPMTPPQLPVPTSPREPWTRGDVANWLMAATGVISLFGVAAIVTGIVKAAMWLISAAEAGWLAVSFGLFVLVMRRYGNRWKAEIAASELAGRDRDRQAATAREAAQAVQDAALAARVTENEQRGLALDERERRLDAWQEEGSRELERAEQCRQSFESSVKDGSFADVLLIPSESRLKDGFLVAKVQIINRLSGHSLLLRGVVWLGVSVDGQKFGEVEIELPSAFRHAGFSGVHTFDIRKEIPAETWTAISGKSAVIVGGNVWGYREKRLRSRDEPSVWFGVVDCWLPVIPAEKDEPQQNVGP